MFVIFVLLCVQFCQGQQQSTAPLPTMVDHMENIWFDHKKPISWQYFTRDEWNEASNRFSEMQSSSHRRELRIARNVFKDLSIMYPWLRFIEGSPSVSGTQFIKFSLNVHDTDEGAAAHAHLGGNTNGHIHLHRYFWKSKSKYGIMVHEVQHLLGLYDNSADKSIMSVHGVYDVGRLFYRDILTTNYIVFRDKFRKKLISPKLYKRHTRKILVRNKLTE